MPLKRTALHPVHEDLGARFTEFSGYEMPVQFSGILDEHRAVREAAGLFDVSHMGNIWIRGDDAEATLSYALTCDASRIEDGQAKYTAILRDDGTIVDDLILSNTPWGWHLVPNAGQAEVVMELLEIRSGRLPGGPADDARFDNVTDDTAILALQGPESQPVLEAFLDRSVDDLGRFRLQPLPEVAEEAFASRTGYTGEHGYELVFPQAQGPQVFRGLLDAGERAGVDILPCGLGARDTLRLEKGYALAGHEFAGGRTPLEANLAWTVDQDHEFVGRDALEAQRSDGTYDRLVALELTERGIPRQGHDILVDDEVVGEVTSGTMSPTLRKGIGLGYVPPEHSKVDTKLAVSIRGNPTPARVVSLPFV